MTATIPISWLPPTRARRRSPTPPTHFGRPDFWLGDAFASGGSAGYDHKKMGITARGAWEAVKRHFREMDIDIQTEPFTAAGVGDMSGDVFGNGMLLSEDPAGRGLRSPRHLHRSGSRSGDLCRSASACSTWAGRPGRTTTSLISKGGGMFSRSAKSIAVSPRWQESFRHRPGQGHAAGTS
jgi:glutamate dehydrogenase